MLEMMLLTRATEGSSLLSGWHKAATFHYDEADVTPDETSMGFQRTGVSLRAYDKNQNLIGEWLNENFGENEILAVPSDAGPITFYTELLEDADSTTLDANISLQFNYDQSGSVLRVRSISDWSDAQLRKLNFINFAVLAEVPDQLPKKITLLDSMFRDCYEFNSANVVSWDTSRIQSMAYAFYKCYSFNQPIGDWDVRNVKSMNNMMKNCEVLNQTINWKALSVTDLTETFANCVRFNGLMDGFEAPNVQIMNATFSTCPAFNRPLPSLDTSNVITMARLFQGCRSFNSVLSNWDTSKVESFEYAFSGALAFNQPLNHLDTSNVQDISSMFASGNFNQPIDQWDVSKVTAMQSMFQSNTSFNQDLSNWVLPINVNAINYDTGATAWQSDFKPQFS